LSEDRTGQYSIVRLLNNPQAHFTT